MPPLHSRPLLTCPSIIIFSLTWKFFCLVVVEEIRKWSSPLESQNPQRRSRNRRDADVGQKTSPPALVGACCCDALSPHHTRYVPLVDLCAFCLGDTPRGRIPGLLDALPPKRRAILRPARAICVAANRVRTNRNLSESLNGRANDDTTNTALKLPGSCAHHEQHSRQSRGALHRGPSCLRWLALAEDSPKLTHVATKTDMLPSAHPDAPSAALGATTRPSLSIRMRHAGHSTRGGSLWRIQCALRSLHNHLHDASSQSKLGPCATTPQSRNLSRCSIWNSRLCRPPRCRSGLPSGLPHATCRPGRRAQKIRGWSPLN